MTNKTNATHAQEAGQGRLLARPTPAPAQSAAATGRAQRLGIRSNRDGLLYVPSSYRVEEPAPLVVMLHGAGGNARQGADLMRQSAEATGFIVLAPDSRGRTWDIILGEYGPDVTFIDCALQHVFRRYAVDTQRLAVGGFSDGASYALSLGITNGDVFSHVIAFSPGFMAPAAQRGAPRIFISHGAADRVLPIDRCSRRIAPQLKRGGYDLRYREFEGGHTVPPEIARAAIEWLIAGSSSKQEGLSLERHQDSH